MTDKVGTVVIGRNEGDRLCRCLESLISKSKQIIYVDSGSSDNSVVLARTLAVEVVELDLSRPFNAARARQQGYNYLLELYPDTDFVFFLDGDCEVIEGWIEQAINALKDRPEVAVVCGRRRERYPEISIYNRICDLEWNTSIGETLSCGGDAMMRVQAYRQVGGFDPTVPAGEEPELCHRLRKAGWKILRIDAEMTWHDASITKFSQWCLRELRTGYGGLDVQRRFGLQDFVRINVSARIWTVGWLLSVFVAWAAGFLLVGSTAAIKAAVSVFMLLPLQIARVAWKGWRKGLNIRDAISYGLLMMLAKWLQVFGQLMKIRECRSQHDATLIEYKSVRDTDVNWLSDLKHYPPRPWLKEQSIWAVAVYRWSRRIDGLPLGPKKQVLTMFYWPIFRLVESVTGISLPKEAKIGPGLRIHHFGNIFIHPEVQIGANCTLRQGVTIGNRVSDGPVPVIGNNVEFGAYAQVLGAVTIGDGAKIGAMSVVLNDVPPGATAVGNPARIVRALNASQE